MESAYTQVQAGLGQARGFLPSDSSGPWKEIRWDTTGGTEARDSGPPSLPVRLVPQSSQWGSRTHLPFCEPATPHILTFLCVFTPQPRPPYLGF